MFYFRQSVEVETQMTSVERILEYSSLEQEPPHQLPNKYQPPINWPSQGRIIFQNVSMSHSNHSSSLLVLHNISLIIEPTDKIGIVGRTGAGKSSFIPQDPVLFTGTMRNNLDQFSHYSDTKIWNALEQVVSHVFFFFDFIMI